MRLSSSFCRSDGWVKDTFDTTLVMSTYLIAITVCDFEFKSGHIDSGVSLIIIASGHSVVMQ